MTITEFLEARIAEDEHEAATMLDSFARGGEVSKRRWNRMLAECAAKRNVVSLHHQGGLRWVGFPRADRQEAYCVEDQHASPCSSLRALATVYADDPDYLPEWAL